MDCRILCNMKLVDFLRFCHGEVRMYWIVFTKLKFDFLFFSFFKRLKYSNKMNELVKTRELFTQRLFIHTITFLISYRIPSIFGLFHLWKKIATLADNFRRLLLLFNICILRWGATCFYLFNILVWCDCCVNGYSCKLYGYYDRP